MRWHGQRQLRQEVQTEALCLGLNGMVPCVENRRWSVGGVTYITLNVPGSCNNLCDTAPDVEEFKARNAANIAWLRAAENGQTNVGIVGGSPLLVAGSIEEVARTILAG